jgi:tetratricopeptide (TPR) repeat protein
MTPYIMIRYDEATKSWVLSVAPDEDGPLQWQVIARYATEEEAASHARELRRQYDGDTEDAAAPPRKSPLRPMRANAGARTAPGLSPEELSGVAYMLPDGRVIAVEDAESFFAHLAETEKNPEELKRLLWGLARECDESAKYDGAVAYLEKILTLEEGPDDRARCFLVMGQVFERKMDFPAAVAAYSRAFTLPARENDTWYLLNNNLGFSLNQIGRHEEAEHCLLRAAQARPEDFRALDHLEDLLAQHDEIGRDHPEILEAAQECREAARTSKRERIM